MHTIENKLKNVELDIAQAIAKTAVLLHPDIIQQCVKYNKEQKAELMKILPTCICELFLFENSDCVYPGVRRRIISEKKKNMKSELSSDKMILDENNYPRHIWSNISTGTKYSSSSWHKNNLNTFEMAHVFAHKDSEVVSQNNYYRDSNSKMNPSALFTSASNVILVPKGLAKPTDKLPLVQHILFTRIIELYGCFVSYPNLKKSVIDPEIQEIYQNMEWNEFYYPDNWKDNLDNLFSSRIDLLTLASES
jgi:hypothetical protein